MALRRALTIGISDFTVGEGTTEYLDPLTFAPRLVAELAEALRGHGYETVAVSDATLGAEALGSAVTKELAAGGADRLVVVHLLSHGQVGHGESTVYVLGSDGRAGPEVDVDHWLRNLQLPDRPLVLFLLDLCSAGTAARLPWQVRVAAERTRAWVIAACQNGGVAYDGRFTRAVISVLRALGRGELDVDPGLEHVPLPVIARAIHQEVNRMVAVEDGYEQRVTASLVDMSVDPGLPFFQNPAYSEESRVRLRSGLDAGITPFLDDLDEGLDARHFLERAAGVGRAPDRVGPLVGCFTGRDSQLRLISPWLSGAGCGPLCVVTGSAGVGKSALLGVLVCAAHPMLRAPTKPVWDRVAQAPLPIPMLAAVHARGRGLAAVVSSIARQLGLPEPGTAADIVTAVRDSPAPPVIVLDALDEAVRPEEIVGELLRPLATLPRTNERDPVRLLVGVRNESEYADLLALAQAADLLVDLDEVPTGVLEDNLNSYVMELLRTTVYRHRGAVCGAFAGQVARVLAAPVVGGSKRWGPFLVAGLYTRYILACHADQPLADAAAAEHLGGQVPCDLPSVFELELRAEPDQPWLLPVMSLLAHAQGQGMPVSVICRAAAAFAPGRPLPSAGEIRAAMLVGKFYLRQSTDTDHTTLYRLFHQGLVDYLRRRVSDSSDLAVPGRLLDALLAPLGPQDGRDWAAGEPYVLRHAVAHAEDAGRSAELLSDPALLLHMVAGGLPATVNAAAIPELQLAQALHRTGEDVGRAHLALHATRAGLTDLAFRLANPTGQPALTWQPRWTAGRPARTPPIRRGTLLTVPAVRKEFRVTGRRHPVAAVAGDGSRVVTTEGRFYSRRLVACDGPDSDPHIAKYPGAAFGAAVSGDGGIVAYVRSMDVVRRDLSQGGRPKFIKCRLAGRRRAAIAMSPDGSLIAWVHYGRDGNARFQVWDQQQNKRNSRYVGSSRVCAVAASQVGAWFAASNADGAFDLWSADRGRRLIETNKILFPGHRGGVRALCISPDGQRVASAGEDAVRVWDVATGQRCAEYDLTESLVQAVALNAGGRYLAWGDESGVVVMYDTLAGEIVAEDESKTGPVMAMAMTPDGRQLVWRTADALQRWTFTQRTALPGAEAWADMPRGPDRPLAQATLNSPVVLDRPGAAAIVAVHDDVGTVHLLSAATGTPDGDSIVGDLRAVDLSRQRAGQRDLLTIWRSGNQPLMLDPLTRRTSIDGVAAWPGLTSAQHARAAKWAVLGDDGTIHIVGFAGSEVLLRSDDHLLGTHDGPVTALATARIGGRPVAFSGSHDGTVRVWDLTGRRLLDVIEIGVPVSEVDATDRGDLVVAADGEVIAFQHMTAAGRSGRR